MPDWTVALLGAAIGFAGAVARPDEDAGLTRVAVAAKLNARPSAYILNV
jgi:hypothetical protein